MSEISNAQYITYPNGLTLDLAQFSNGSRETGQRDDGDAKHVHSIAQAVADGSLARCTLEIFCALDVEGDGDVGIRGGPVGGRMGWGDGELRDFAHAVFDRIGLRRPSEACIYAIFKAFNPDERIRLDVRECLCLADALVRNLLFHARPTERSHSQNADQTTDSFPSGRSPFERASLTPGTRVRVAQGRHFQHFGAGDVGTVTSAHSVNDASISCCEVLFDGRKQPVSIGARYLQTLEAEDAQGMAASKRGEA